MATARSPSTSGRNLRSEGAVPASSPVGRKRSSTADASKSVIPPALLPLPDRSTWWRLSCLRRPGAIYSDLWRHSFSHTQRRLIRSVALDPSSFRPRMGPELRAQPLIGSGTNRVWLKHSCRGGRWSLKGRPLKKRWRLLLALIRRAIQPQSSLTTLFRWPPGSGWHLSPSVPTSSRPWNPDAQ